VGELTQKKLEQVARGNTFIETGFYHGSAVGTALEYGFTDIVSIELNPEFVATGLQSFAMFSNVKIIHGDSPSVLLSICPNLSEQATFWLDGHYSGADTALSSQYGVGPVLAELKAIATSPYKEHVIMIDDSRDFGSPGWPSKQDALDIIMSINPNYKIAYLDGYTDQHPNDIMVCYV
jgi:hypothetical protein